MGGVTTPHTPTVCRFKDATCHACNKKGHLASACWSKTLVQEKQEPKKSAVKAPKKRYGKYQRAKWVQAEEGGGSGDSEPELPMHKIEHSSTHPITVTLDVNDKRVKMEVDTGAAVTIITEKVKDQLFPNTPLRKSSLRLKTYTGETMPVLGEMPATVTYGEQKCSLTLTVVAGRGSCLLGRDWLSKLRLDWKTIGSVRLSQGKVQLNNLLKKYDSVFRDKASLRVKVGQFFTVQDLHPSPYEMTLARNLIA